MLPSSETATAAAVIIFKPRLPIRRFHQKTLAELHRILSGRRCQPAIFWASLDYEERAKGSPKSNSTKELFGFNSFNVPDIMVHIGTASLLQSALLAVGSEPGVVIMGTKSSLSARISGSAPLRYALATAAVLIALLLNTAMNPFVGDRALYLLLLPAVAFAAWYCGIGPCLLAIALGLAGAMYGTLTTVHAFRVPTVSESVLLLVFLCSSIILVALAETRRRHNETLVKAQGELESRVQERTADLDCANQNLRKLSARLLQLQDDERRRIARELHDSVGQMLAALNMNLSAVRADIERLSKTANALADSENLVHEMTSEVRTISHLLHPPLLDEAGLTSALRWYVDGFSLRSKINVDLDLPDDFGRLTRESETAIFRVIQECLTNIHRHSGSPIAKIRLRQRDHQVFVEVADKGKGIPPEKQQEMATSGTPGVGIRGMRERLRQLGGTLEIDSDGSGTVVMVRLPVDAIPSQSNPVEVTDPSPAAA